MVVALCCAQNVDYIGLNPTREHLLFYTSSPETLRDLKIPMNIIKKYGSVTVNSDLADAHLYVFNRYVSSQAADAGAGFEPYVIQASGAESMQSI